MKSSTLRPVFHFNFNHQILMLPLMSDILAHQYQSKLYEARYLLFRNNFKFKFKFSFLVNKLNSNSCASFKLALKN